VGGMGGWIACLPQVSLLGERFPGQLAGLLTGVVAMVFGSLAPQWLKNRHEHKHHVRGLPDEAQA